MPVLKHKYYYVTRLMIFFLLTWIIHLPSLVFGQNENKTFGDSIFITNGLLGKVYLLPDTTTRLPAFDTLQPVSTIYTTSLNIPARSWDKGFPGIPDRFEWFGIEYTGFFKAAKPGTYSFRLMSDDGSKLFIDGKLIIDNDGAHGAYSKTGEILLDDSKHSIKVDYFQGPRFQIALQLFSNLKNSPEEIFPGNNFILSTPKAESHRLLWIILFSGIILVLIYFLILKKREKKQYPN